MVPGMYLFFLKYFFHCRYMLSFVRAALQTLIGIQSLKPNLIPFKKQDLCRVRSRTSESPKYQTPFENKKQYHPKFRPSEILGPLNSCEGQGRVSGGSKHIEASGICCHPNTIFNFSPKFGSQS